MNINYHDKEISLDLESMLEFLFFKRANRVHILQSANQRLEKIRQVMHDNLEPKWDRTNLKRDQVSDEFCQRILKVMEQRQETKEENKLYYLDTEEILYKKRERAQNRLVLPKPYVRKCSRISMTTQY